MPFEYLDIILVGIMLVSGLLALMRGFTREVLSLVAWGAAGVAALGAAFNPELKRFAGQYLQPELVAAIAVGAGAFLLVLIIMSLISVKLADLVLDSAAGPFDRTIGFFYGLARGFLLVVVVYLFYIWWIPREDHFSWVRNAKSLPVIEQASQVVISFLPVDIAETLQGKTYFGSRGPNHGTVGADSEEDPKYNEEKKRKLDQLIESTQGGGGTTSQNE